MKVFQGDVSVEIVLGTKSLVAVVRELDVQAENYSGVIVCG